MAMRFVRNLGIENGKKTATSAAALARPTPPGRAQEGRTAVEAA
jgi:hypothetical protein